MKQILNEVTRTQILDKSKRGANYAPSNQSKGKNRYARRNHSSIPHRVENYSRIDMNTFFKRDILTFVIDVKGETNNYKVKIKLLNVLDELKRVLKSTNREIEQKNVLYALIKVFEHEDVYVWCSCPDFKYRMNYHAAEQGYNSEPQPKGSVRWSDGEKSPLPWTDEPIRTNPNDDKGAGCKHICLVLANKDWVMNVASSINNYVHYMQEHEDQARLYQSIIFPALYDRPYSDEIQQQLFNPETGKAPRNYLNTGRKVLTRANKLAKERGKFKKGNKLGYRFAKEKDDNDQIQLDLDKEVGYDK